MTIQYVSLFSGAGGMDEGLHRAGLKPFFCCELDKHARESLKKWAILRKVSPIIESDVCDVDLTHLRNLIEDNIGKLPLLVGGPPCQSFSLIGKRRSVNDERGQLLYQMVRYAEALQPEVVLIEQVKGLLSAKGSDGERGSALSYLLKEFERLDYHTNFKLLRTSDYGVPQNRERVFLVCSKNSKFKFPEPTHSKDTDNKDMFSQPALHVTVGEALAGLGKPVSKGQTPLIECHIDITPRRDEERINGVPEGDFLARQLHLPDAQRMRLNPKKDSTKFRRLHFKKPSLTLRCGEVFYHPTENRYLTPRECMRIHGFSDEQVLVGPIRGRSGSVKDLDQHRQVANAVPPPIAELLGNQIVSQYFS